MSNPAPTVISNFEILFTPQLPPAPAFPANVEAVVENVIKGYFLTITNPNPVAYTYMIGFHCNTNPSPPQAVRTLASAVAFIDDATTGVATLLSGGANATDFFTEVTVQANGTILLGVLPAFFNAGTGQFVTPNIEVRGWVDITLPALRRRPPPFVLGYVAQSSTPVAVILTAEQRLTFLPEGGEASTVVESQSAFALPLAGGSAQIMVPPQPSSLGFPER